MEQQHTPSPSIASLLNPIQPYHSPPTKQQQQQQQQQQHTRPSKRTKTNNNNNNNNDINHSILFNPNPSPASMHASLGTQSPSSSSNTNTKKPSNTIQTNLEHSIFGIAPYDQFTWTIAQFIWQHARQYWENGQAHLVEIEAKLGTIRDKRSTGERMYYPIGTESPILDTRDTKFQSDMSIQQHENLNRLLNQRVTESNSIGYSGSKVDYLHLRQIDEFFDSQVRVSRDWKSGHKSSSSNNSNNNNNNNSTQNNVPRSIVKEKIAHLDIHCPGRPFDFRISVNVEQPVPLPHPNMTPKFQRIKDRLSYSHQICQIDLTQVKTTDLNGSSTHEVEVEFKNSQEVLRAASIWSDNQEGKNTNQPPPPPPPPPQQQQPKKKKKQEEMAGLFGEEEEDSSSSEEEEEEGEENSEEDSEQEQETEEGIQENVGGIELLNKNNKIRNGVKKKKKVNNNNNNNKQQQQQNVLDHNYYLVMVEVFLNNIRMLILNCQ